MTFVPYANQWRDIGVILERVAALRDDLRAASGIGATESLDRCLDETRAKWSEQTFRVSVLALAKSGKSSLLNSWLGGEFLPMSSTPETARMVRIRHTPLNPVGRLLQDGEVVAIGADDIRTWLKRANEAVRSGAAAGADLVLEASLCALRDHELGEHRFEIIDTPGPNEAGVHQLRAWVDAMIEQSDVVVYLLDYTKLKTEEEEALFGRLRDMRPELLRECADRLFFVLNKVDQADRNALPPDKAREYVVRVLRDQLRHLVVTPERILPASASHALLARLVLQGTPTDAVLEDFAKIAFGWERPTDLQEYTVAAPRLLERSGVPTIEGRILTHVFESRSQLLLSSLSADIQRCLDLEDNLLATARRSASMGAESLAAALAAIRRDLQETAVELERLSRLTADHTARIERFVAGEMGRFRESTRSRIDQAFAASIGWEVPSTSWLQIGLDFVRQRVGSLLSGGGRDRASVQAQVQEINAMLASELDASFADFRGRLESHIQTHQSDLYADLDRAIQPIVRRAEQKVGEALNVNLPPVRVRVAAPSALETQRQIEQGVAQIVESSSQRHSGTYTQRQLVRPAGFCRSAQFAEREIPFHFERTDPHAVVAGLRKLWSDRIDDMAEGSVATARRLIRDEVGAGIARVRAEVERYVGSYTAVVEEEERRKRADATGQDERRRALDEAMHRLVATQLDLDVLRTGLSGAPGWLASPSAALAQLLSTIFQEGELRSWIGSVHGGSEVRLHLPGEGTALATLADAAAARLVSRGLVGRDLFESIEATRPDRRRDIRRAAAIAARAPA